MKPICWYWDSQLKTLQTSQNLSWPQIDFEEYDESGAARQRWRAAVDAVDGTAGGEGWGSAVMFLGLHPYSLKGDIKGIYMVYNYIVYKSGNYIYIYLYLYPLNQAGCQASSLRQLSYRTGALPSPVLGLS